MKQFYIPFGDWWSIYGQQDCYHKILVAAPSMESLLKAEMKIKEKYGKYFFQEFAEETYNPHFGAIVWTALQDANYPLDRFLKLIKYNNKDYCNYNTIEQLLLIHPDPEVSLAFVEDAFIWLLNNFGADIKVLDECEEIPTINYWTCPGFETVGYGCDND